ncbi:MAG: hypothetical protein OHK0053_23910 [Microscillaceae bacterium]
MLAGPSFGIGLGGKAEASALGFSESIDIKFGDDDGSGDLYLDNRLDFGLQFGGGVSLQLGPGSVVLDARYGLGLSNWFEEEDLIDTQSSNRTFALSLGYMIPLGGN